MTFRALAWRDGVPTDAPTDISGVSEALADPDVLLWADLVRPTQDDLAVLADELGIDRNAIEDAVAPHERAKAQQLDEYTYFVTYATLRMFATTDGDEEDELSKIAGFAFPGGLVTVRTTDALDLATVLTRIKANRDLLRLGTPTLVHAFLDVIVDGYFDTVQELDDLIEDLEGDLFSPEARTTEFQRQAYDVRTKLVTLRRIVLPMREVISVIWRHRPEEVRELDPYYSDLIDHALRAAEWTESLRDMISSVFETHLSLQDQRLNNVMKKLAGWAAVISIPTLVTGWFGQNVPYPGNGTLGGFIWSVVLVIVPAAVVYALMRRNDWI